MRSGLCADVPRDGDGREWCRRRGDRRRATHAEGAGPAKSWRFQVRGRSRRLSVFLPPEEKEWVAEDTSEHIGKHQTIRLCCFRARHPISRAWPCSLLFPRALSLHPALFATIPPNHSTCSQSHAPPSFLRRPPPPSACRPLRTPEESGLAGRLQRAGSSGSGSCGLRGNLRVRGGRRGWYGAS
jgi:hypothetical protein